MKTRLAPMSGYRLRLVPTDKFKTAHVQFRFAAPFRPETLNLRALLPYVLLAGTAKLPTKRRLADKCDWLYGTQLSANVSKQGMMNVVTFGLTSVNERYLPGDARIFDDALDLFADVLFRPRLMRDAFRKGAVREEVRLLREDLEADYADKAEYSFQRMAEHMFRDELARYRAKGDYDTLPSVTAEALTAAWRDMLQHDYVECTVVGAFSDEAILAQIGARFAFAAPASAPLWIDVETKAVSAPDHVVEQGDVSQARLQLGYRSPTRAGTPDYFGMLVMNALFGDSDTSLLFRTVRERERLCYYVYSSYASAKGAAFVSAGVEPGREEAAAALCETVRETIAAGAFSDDDLDLAKNAVIKRMRQATDSIRGIVQDYAHFDRLYDRQYDLDENVALIRAVTREAVSARARELVLDTVYALSKEVA